MHNHLSPLSKGRLAAACRISFFLAVAYGLLALPIAWQIPGELNSLTNAERAKAPALFIHSGQDEVVPLPYQQKVFQSSAGLKRTILRPGAAHNTPLTAAERRRAVGLLRELLEAPGK